MTTACAVARPRRAGAGVGDFVRWQKRDLRKLRRNGHHWSLLRNTAEQVLRFHADAVNSVALLKDGRAATAGADGRIAIWTPGNFEPDSVMEGLALEMQALLRSTDCDGRNSSADGDR